MTNQEALNERIRASGLKKNYIAKVLGITPTALSHKIANRCDFKAREINALCSLLNIEDPKEKESIFFAA